jgi:hypothetical protein
MILSRRFGGIGVSRGSGIAAVFCWGEAGKIKAPTLSRHGTSEQGWGTRFLLELKNAVELLLA